MNNKLARWATLAALCTAAVSAHAANVTLTGWAYGAGNVVQTNLYTGAAGGFAGSMNGAGTMNTDALLTYCIELEEFFSFSNTAMKGYSIVEGASYFARRRGDADIADRLGRLFTYVADNPTAVDSAFESSALQLAVWNTVYDTDYSVSSTTGFRYTNTTNRFGTYADELMAGAQGVAASRFDVFALEKTGSQDFVLLSAKAPATRGNDVPEPGTLALGLAALAGLALTRRRGQPG